MNDGTRPQGRVAAARQPGCKDRRSVDCAHADFSFVARLIAGERFQPLALGLSLDGTALSVDAGAGAKPPPRFHQKRLLFLR